MISFYFVGLCNARSIFSCVYLNLSDLTCIFHVSSERLCQVPLLIFDFPNLVMQYHIVLFNVLSVSHSCFLMKTRRQLVTLASTRTDGITISRETVMSMHDDCKKIEQLLDIDHYGLIENSPTRRTEIYSNASSLEFLLCEYKREIFLRVADEV